MYNVHFTEDSSVFLSSMFLIFFSLDIPRQGGCETEELSGNECDRQPALSQWLCEVKTFPLITLKPLRSFNGYVRSV